MKSRIKLLITSAGSLVGENILDAIESRRHLFEVIGLNTHSDNPRIFRCDKAYRVDLSSEGSYLVQLIEILIAEQPDLVLPGRDQDVMILANLAEVSPQFRNILPVGSVQAALIMNDKAKSYEFASRHNLPFVQTYVLTDSNLDMAQEWAETIGYPLICKPREGFGSLGIRIVCDNGQLKALIRSGHAGVILQKLMGLGHQWNKRISEYLETMHTGIPFFFHLPDDQQYAGQTIILRDGSIGPVFTSKNLMVLGRCERTEMWDDPDLIATVTDYARAMAAEGWRGLLNLQCRRTENGYMGIEMNGRVTGSTSARYYFAFDEIGLLLQEFTGIHIDIDHDPFQRHDGVVFRSLKDDYVSKKDQKDFDSGSVWLNKSRAGDIQ